MDTASIVYPILGCLLLAVTIYDLVKTTLAAAGGAPISKTLGRSIWHLTGRAHYAGPLILVATAVVWVGLLWVGWTLVFMGAPGAVVSASSEAPADFWSRLYFAGYTVATLGLGDFVPDTPLWRQITAISAFSGLVFITLAVTYYTAVLGAVVQKQQLAALIDGMGNSPADIVAGAWDGESFQGVDSVLPTLASLVALHARRHYAYPVVHYFRSADPEETISVQLARLYDALVLFDRVVDPDHRPPPVSIRMARRSTRTLLDTLHPDFVTAAEEAPPQPELAPLRRAGVPLTESDIFADEGIRAARRILLGFVHESHFSWLEVDRDAR